MLMIPNDKTALLFALAGQPDDRKVEADADTGISAQTVRDLREMPSWPGGLVVNTPRENYPEVVVKIRRAN